MSNYYIGCRLSLMSKAKLRYEGTLAGIDTEKCTVELHNVQSFGTEDRVPEKPVARTPGTYDLIIFNGHDLEDLQVIPQKEEGIEQQDPAIINAPKKTAKSDKPATPKEPGSSLLGSGPNKTTSRDNSMSRNDPIGTQPNKAGAIGQNPANQRGGLGHDVNRSAFSKPNENRNRDRDLDRDNNNNKRDQLRDQANSNKNLAGRRDHGNNSTSSSNRNEMNNRETRNENINNNNRDRHDPMNRNPQNHWKSQGMTGASVMHAGNRAAQMKKERDERAAKARAAQMERQKKLKEEKERKEKEELEKYKGEFDFDGQNAKFDKDQIAKELEKLNIGKDGKKDQKQRKTSKDDDKVPDKDNSKGDTLEEGEIKSDSEPESEQEEEQKTYYEPKKSFFDSISCEATDPKGERVPRYQERKLNAETFGIPEKPRRHYGHNNGRMRGNRVYIGGNRNQGGIGGGRDNNNRDGRDHRDNRNNEMNRNNNMGGIGSGGIRRDDRRGGDMNNNNRRDGNMNRGYNNGPKPIGAGYGNMNGSRGGNMNDNYMRNGGRGNMGYDNRNRRPVY